MLKTKHELNLIFGFAKLIPQIFLVRTDFGEIERKHRFRETFFAEKMVIAKIPLMLAKTSERAKSYC